jgi:hypothetical protein
MPQGDSAGTLTLTGTQVDGGVTIAFDGSGYGRIADQPWYLPGDTITASATGGMVPAFSGESVVVPNAITITAPACGGGDCGGVDRSADYSVTWTGTTPNVQVILSSIKSDAGVLTEVFCNFASSPGVVPAEMLSHLNSSSDDFNGYVEISAAGATSFDAGNYFVIFSVTNGSALGGDVTIQ